MVVVEVEVDARAVVVVVDACFIFFFSVMMLKWGKKNLRQNKHNCDLSRSVPCRTARTLFTRARQKGNEAVQKGGIRNEEKRETEVNSSRRRRRRRRRRRSDSFFLSFALNFSRVQVFATLVHSSAWFLCALLRRCRARERK